MVVHEAAFEEAIIDEHDLYPVHEEDSVPVIPQHFWENNYTAYAIQMSRPDLWVIGDTCLYWEKGNLSLYRAPDVAVIAGSAPEKWPRVYLNWVDPPLLFVAELASRSTLQEDTGPKAEIFEQKLRAQEYLYTNREDQTLKLWRMVEGRYRPIPADGEGRVWSEQLRLGFGYDQAGLLKVYTRDGQALPTYNESQQARAEAEERALHFQERAQLFQERAQLFQERAQQLEVRVQSEAAARADAERRAQLSQEVAQTEAEARIEAETRAQAEVESRVAAERRVQEEAAARAEAETRAQEEAVARGEAERRLAELMAELQRLRQPGPPEQD